MHTGMHSSGAFALIKSYVAGGCFCHDILLPRCLGLPSFFCSLAFSLLWLALKSSCLGDSILTVYKQDHTVLYGNDWACRRL
jgi:hypothetical protein